MGFFFRFHDGFTCIKYSSIFIIYVPASKDMKIRMYIMLYPQGNLNFVIYEDWVVEAIYRLY